MTGQVTPSCVQKSKSAVVMGTPCNNISRAAFPPAMSLFLGGNERLGRGKRLRYEMTKKEENEKETISYVLVWC